MRRRLVWLVMLPLSIAGSELSHALTNALLGSPTGEGGELLQGAGPGAGLVPELAIAAILLVLLALAIGARTSSRARLSALPFALLAPGIFVLQEHLEHALHTGAVPSAVALEPTFLPGLLLQLPFALVAYALARALLRIADGVRRLIGRDRSDRRPAASRCRRPPLRRERPRTLWRSSSHPGRAPPAARFASG